MDNDYIMMLKTVQIAPFRTLMVALKDILGETDITFKKMVLKLLMLINQVQILVHIHLHADNFEFYECKKEKVIVGVNMFHLFKLINTIDNDETLSMYIKESDYHDGIVESLYLKFENKNIKQCKIQQLKLIEPEQQELSMPNVTFSSIINIPSTDFQKIVRDLNNISDKVEIKSIKNQLIFKCDGPFANVEIVRSESDGNMDFIQKNNSIIQGVFSLKKLNYFIKCTNLCNQIEIYLENDLPLIVKYNVASLGEIKLGLTSLPTTQED